MSDPLRERLLRLLFPHKCFCCTALLPDGGYLCPACAKTLPRIEPGRFPNLPPFVRVAAPLYYKDGVRQGIHRFKYDGRSYYAAFLAGLMAERLLEIPGLPRFDLLTYVPPAPHKLRQRGFCPAGMLAQQLSRRLKIRVRDGLIGHTENTVAPRGTDFAGGRCADHRLYRAKMRQPAGTCRRWGNLDGGCRSGAASGMGVPGHATLF